MGDSTKQARTFMRQCHTALAALTQDSVVAKSNAQAPANEAEMAAPKPCPHETAQALADVQSAAKLNNARAIYRAAQTTLDALNAAKTITPHISSLASLIAQYEEGLIELEGLEEEAAQKAKTPNNDLPVNEASPDVNIIPIEFSGEARQARAIDALSSSLQHANDSEHPALSKLLALSTAQTTKTSDTKESLETSDLPEVDSVLPSAPAPIEAIKAEGRVIAAESFISEIIQFGLTQARQQNLTLSLSYDVSNLSLGTEDALSVQTRLEYWIGHLVTHLAANQDADSLAHIDIGYENKTLRLLANTAPFPQSVLDTASDNATIHQNENALTGHLELVLSELFSQNAEKAAALSPAKLPVEEGIGARLSALMETDISDANASIIAFEPVRAGL